MQATTSTLSFWTVVVRILSRAWYVLLYGFVVTERSFRCVLIVCLVLSHLIPIWLIRLFASFFFFSFSFPLSPSSTSPTMCLTLSFLLLFKNCTRMMIHTQAD